MSEAVFKLRVTIEPDEPPTVVQKNGEPSTDTAACAFFKSVEESRVTVGLAYPHSRPDVGVAADHHIDFAGRTAVERACWAFTSKSRLIGLNHKDGTEGHGEVVESAIHRGPDWVVKSDNGTETRIVDGDWILAVRWDPETWNLIYSKSIPIAWTLLAVPRMVLSGLS